MRYSQLYAGGIWMLSGGVCVEEIMIGKHIFCHHVGKTLPSHWQNFAIAVAKFCQCGGKESVLNIR